MARIVLMGMFLAGVGSATEITNIRLHLYPNNSITSTAVVLLEYDEDWVSVCYNGDKKNWGKRESIVACRQIRSEGGWPVDVFVNGTDLPTRHLNNFDCGASLSNLEDCVYDEVRGECLDAELAGIQCYDLFDVRLTGGATPNAGRVEVMYDGVWSNVCYESARSETRPWSFSNVQVVCKELGFPGAMFAKQGGMGQGNMRTIVDGYKCREDLREKSLRDCFPNNPILLPSEDLGPSCGNGSAGIGNDAVAICAVPGYIGCFESKGNTQMEFQKMQLLNMTISMCRKHCRIHNYTHAYLHKGDICFCGNEIIFNHVEDVRCGKKCAGDSHQVCGHDQTLSIYDVTIGLCDDPLNKTNIYYYGDIFDGFKCDYGMELVGASFIQCVMGDSPSEMRWNNTFPECEDIIHATNKVFVIGASVGGVSLLVLVLVAVLLVFFSRKTHTQKRNINKVDDGNESANSKGDISEAEGNQQVNHGSGSVEKNSHNVAAINEQDTWWFQQLWQRGVNHFRDMVTVQTTPPQYSSQGKDSVVEEIDLIGGQSFTAATESTRKNTAILKEIDSKENKEGSRTICQNKPVQRPKKKKGKYETVPYEDQSLTKTGASDEKIGDGDSMNAMSKPNRNACVEDQQSTQSSAVASTSDKKGSYKPFFIVT